MKRILITGVSGTGKSTVIQELRQRGFHAVDADEDGYSAMAPAADAELTGPGGGMDWVWQSDRIQKLLDDEVAEILFFSGCSPSQGDFYAQLDVVILPSASKPVIAERLRSRTTNNFGKRPDELARTLQLVDEIEQLLRYRANLVIDTTVPLDEVVATILEFVR